jgi:formylglycine-generating enzyme required for sulfatase activity
MDFGISKALEDSDIENHTVIGTMGTKAYMSPEQALNASDVDKRCDIYSAGIVFYELLTKQKPENTLLKEPLPPSKFNEKISLELDSIILQMIAPKPELRQDDFAKVISQLDAIFMPKTEIKVQTTQEVKKVEEVAFDKEYDKEKIVFIPEGNFFRGSGRESNIEIEKPRRKVFLDSFYIGKYCVTNLEYKTYLEEANKEIKEDLIQLASEKPNFPVVDISYNEALEFCKFYGGTLPTEAQWERAAKGAKNYIYPWGNEFDEMKVNIGNRFSSPIEVDKLENGISYEGCYQLAGNVWEWCLDDFEEDFYKRNSNPNPVALNGSDKKVIRGGSFDFVKFASRASYRFYSISKANNIGFRIAFTKA